MTSNALADPERLRLLLGDLARARRLVTYAELCELFEMGPPHRIHRLTEMLEDLVRADHAAGHPLAAAVAVGRGPARIPGRGFFQLLQELGRYEGPDRGPAAAACHAQELTALHATLNPEGNP